MVKQSILVVHNRYQVRGGEDGVVENEVALLQRHDHPVATCILDNRDGIASKNSLALAAGTVWSQSGVREVRNHIERTNPDIVHFHNTFPLISPAAYYAAKSMGRTVVQTLHNYRLICPGALLLRDGQVCEDCVGKAIPYPGVQHGCYRNSRLASGAVAAMLTTHRVLGTWQRQVDRYIALTQFARAKFIAGGLPEHKIAIKPNFLATAPEPCEPKEEYALFVGRPSREKGIDILLRAWKGLGRLPLRIAGGPVPEVLRQLAGDNPAIEFLGEVDSQRVRELMGRAAVLVCPSVWYEGFPMVIAESLASGLPIVASNLGGLAELVDDGRTGLLFGAGDAAELAEKISWIMAHPEERAGMGRAARHEYVTRYTAEENYQMLMKIYAQAQGGD